MTSKDPDAAIHEPVLPTPNFRELTRVWFRIGCLSFGGPAGQIAMMHRILVDEKQWLDEDRFLHALSFCMLLPGPEAQQLATYSGWLLRGWRGGLIAGLLFILPGLAVILALSLAYVMLADVSWFESMFFGLKAAVLVIVVDALIRIARRALKSRIDIMLAVTAFLALFALNLPFPVVVLGAGLTGFLWNRFGTAGPVRVALKSAGETGSSSGFLKTAAVWAGIWALPFVLLITFGASSAVFWDIALFFSQMAMVTFGGAYAVLAYVAQQAVETYNWLLPGEMLDGLGLAETTPGPLVLVLTYVGFLAGFRDPGTENAILSGFAGAMLATWVTFAPCFLWVFAGAPHIERLRGNVSLSAALSAITAAIVGVIFNLALWFALHVLFRETGTVDTGFISMSWPVLTTIDWRSAILILVAGLALFGLKWSVLMALAVTAFAGVLLGVLSV